MQQIPNLTSLRFLLALLVIFLHVPEFFANRNLPFFNNNALFLKGSEAVWMFFSLSGFLIIKQLYSEKNLNSNINLKRFFKNRIYRIFPLYYMVLIYGFIHYQILIPKLGFTIENNYNLWEGIILSTTFFSNIFATYSPGGILEILWSIGIEEQFYILIAPILYFIPKNKIVTTLWISTITLLLLFTNSTFDILHTYKMYFFYFSFGGICAIQLQKTNFNKLVTNTIYLLILIYFFSNFIQTNLTINQYHVFSMLLFGVFLSVVSKNPIALLENKIFKYLGTISYGIYMFHAIAMQIVGLIYMKFNLQNHISSTLYIISYTALIILLTIIMAHFSFKYYESYFLKFKKPTSLS